MHLLQFWMSESCSPNKSARRILQTTLLGSLWQIDTRLFGAWNKCSHPRQTAVHTWGLGCNAAFQCVAKGLAILMRFTPARPVRPLVLASFAHYCLFLSSSVSRHANVNALPFASSMLLAEDGDSLASESTFLGLWATCLLALAVCFLCN